MASAPSRTPADYLARAASCELVAESTVSPETREIMLYLARRWRAFAAEAERGSPDRPAQPMPSDDGEGAHENRE